jgi:hypothetical protein
MQAVAGQHGPRTALRAVAVPVHVAVVVMRVSVVIDMGMLMAVVPKLHLVEQEEHHEPAQQHGKQGRRFGAALKGLRQQMHEGRGEQSARCQAQQIPTICHKFLAARGEPQDGSGKPHTANASHEGGDQDAQQVHGITRSEEARAAPQMVSLGSR